MLSDLLDEHMHLIINPCNKCLVKASCDNSKKCELRDKFNEKSEKAYRIMNDIEEWVMVMVPWGIGVLVILLIIVLGFWKLYELIF